MVESEASLRYQLDKIQTANTEELGLMLFQAVLRSCRSCQSAMIHQEWDKMGQEGQLVQDIMLNMAFSLDMTHPEAGRMRSLYLYCWQTMISAQFKHDPEALDSVITVISNLISGLKGFLAKGRTEEKLAGTVSFSG